MCGEGGGNVAEVGFLADSVYVWEVGGGGDIAGAFIL